MFFETAGPEAAAVGFKVMVSQIGRFPSIASYLQREKVHCLCLLRRNVFDTALSYIKAKLTGDYHDFQAHARAADVAVTVDSDEFGILMENCEMAKRRVLELHRTLGGRLVSYEDMVTDWDNTIASIGTDLGINDLRVGAVVTKLAAEHAGLRIVNEAELRRIYANAEAS